MRLCLILLFTSLTFAEEISFQFAGLTLTPEPWNKESNFAKLAKFARQAAARGARRSGGSNAGRLSGGVCGQ